MVNKLSAKDSYTIATKGFLFEALQLSNLAEQQDLKTLIPWLAKQQTGLTEENDTLLEKFHHLTNNARPTTINLGQPSSDLEQLISIINVAATSTLFSGWRLSVDSLDKLTLAKLTQDAFSKLPDNKPQASQILSSKLNNGDTLRVMQLLHFLDLNIPNSMDCNQLSIAASGGTRDRIAMHQTPNIKFNSGSSVVMTANQPEVIAFDTNDSTLNHIVMIDNDPDLKGRYKKLNDDNQGTLLAINCNFEEAIEKTYQLIKSKDLRPRNIVAGFRIDHHMIQSAENFIASLSKVIVDEAPLILTIGAGHDDLEFSGRIQKMKEIYDELIAQKMNPIHIKCYRGNNINEQRNNPVFGQTSYATYEIIYCKLAAT